MSIRLLARLGAGSGIAYAGLIVVAAQTEPKWPALSGSPRSIGAFIADHPPTTMQWAGGYLEVLALLAFVVFVAYLWRVLRDAEPHAGWLPGVALCAGLLTAAIKLASLPAAFAGLYRAKEGISPQLATALVDMNSVAFALTWATTALMLAATATVALRTGVLARWLGWSGLAIAVALLASVPFFTADPPTFLLAWLWIIAVSVALIGRADTPTVASSTHASASQPITASAAR